jgi:hypothetical protein
MSLELNEAERFTLQELSLHHRYADFRRRALGVLALVKGHPLPVVADILGVHPQTVYNWLKAWRTLGLMGLLDGHQVCCINIIFVQDSRILEITQPGF